MPTRNTKNIETFKILTKLHTPTTQTSITKIFQNKDSSPSLFSHLPPVNSCKYLYTPTKKYPSSRNFLRQISTFFGNFLKKYLRYRNFIYLVGKPQYPAFRNFINIGCGYAPLNESKTVFTQKGVADKQVRPHPMSLNLQNADIQSFPMRYITSLQHMWFWI